MFSFFLVFRIYEFRFRPLESLVSIYVVDLDKAIVIDLSLCLNGSETVECSYVFSLLCLFLLRCFGRFQWHSWSEFKRISTRDMVVDRNGYNYLTQQLEQRVLVLLAHPEEISKLAKVKALVTKMKGVMMENIEKALDRSEKIKILVDLRSKYSNLPFPSYGQEDIITPGTKITRKMWFQNMKFKLIVLGTSSSRFVLITERRRRLR
ncbi:unnamed protein product [Arabidopsis thaliana]|uniref:V-SNARE coiled-coil homology domain-containing protein n=2 Tax=Arabidopsis thaliana TaxID=3702 RepID=Q9LRX2_ARATH|nr:unnamed protein product [Arabidopsis thaliana]